MTDGSRPLASETPRIQAPGSGWSEEAAGVARRIAATRGGVPAPFAVLLHIPEAALRVAEVGEYLRFRGTLRPETREAAIIATARERQCRFELDYHQPLAMQAGISATDVHHLALGEHDRLTAEIALIDSFVRQLCRDNDVTDRTYDRAVAAFGVVGLVELATVVGYYSLIAAVLNTARVATEDIG